MPHPAPSTDPPGTAASTTTPNTQDLLTHIIAPVSLGLSWG
jgi:hypothetical protein